MTRRIHNHHFPIRLGAAAALLLTLLIAGCSTGQQAGLLAGDQPAAVATPERERLGSGASIVGVMAFSEPGNLSDGAANSMHLAARLAAQTLANNPATIEIRQPGPSEQAVRRAAEELAGAGAGLVVTGSDRRLAAVAAAALASRDIPTISLSPLADAGKQAYAAGFSPGEEAAALIAEAKRRGYSAIGIVATPDGPSRELAAAIDQAATGAGIATTALDGATAEALLGGLGALATAGTRPSAIVFATGPLSAARLIEGLEAGSAVLAGIPLVGNAGWATAEPLPEALAASWFPSIAREGLAAFSRTYRAAYGSNPTLAGAMTYDLVIMAAALPQAVPDNPYAPAVLTGEQGFRGFTGRFRFGTDNVVAPRSYEIVTAR